MFGTISANAKAWPLMAEAHPPARRLRRPGRRVPGAARPAHALGAARAASSLRARDGALAARRGPRSPGCCIRRWKAIPAMRSGNGISPAPPACSASCSSRRRKQAVDAMLDTLEAVRHGLFLGRLREPRHSLRLRRLSHGHQMGAGRPDACGSISGWRMSTISRPISIAASRPSTRRAASTPSARHSRLSRPSPGAVAVAPRVSAAASSLTNSVVPLGPWPSFVRRSGASPSALF